MVGLVNRCLWPKMVIRCALRAAVLLVLTTAPAFGWTESWEAIRNQARQTESLQARFEQQKHMKFLTRPLVSEGVMVFAAPHNLRWEYTSPVKSVLLATRSAVKRYVFRDQTWQRDEAASLQGVQVVLDEMRRWLAGEFGANPDFDATLTASQTILLTPKTEALSGFISAIEITPAARPGVIDTVRISESDDAFTLIRFIDVQRNVDIDLQVFQKAP